MFGGFEQRAKYIPGLSGARLRGKIRTLTAEGRFQAIILLALPPLVLLAIFFLNPRYGQVLVDHPNIVYFMFGSEALGALFIRKIINFDY